MLASMLDNDQYKFTMQQAALQLGFETTPVEYSYKCRTTGVDLRPAKKHILEGLHSLYNLKFRSYDLDYLESMRYISDKYLSFLKYFRYDPSYISIDFDAPYLALRIKGPFFQTTLFEVPILAIISESWSRLHPNANENTAWNLLEKSIEKAKIFYPDDHIYILPKDFSVAEFGTRRRKDYDWQDKVNEHMIRYHIHAFAGTSNLHLARKHNITAIGTQAHEWYLLHQQLDYRLSNFQKAALENWVKVYRGDLGIALADTINTDAFLKDFDDPYFCKLFDGVREDSESDPINFGHRIANFYISKKINPRGKSIVFSNSLNFEKASKIWKELHNIIGVSFGIGTHLTNNWGFPALNIVLKMVSCNGQPVAKISNAPGKTMCEDEGFYYYLKRVYEVDN